MRDINKFFGIGRLTADPEIRTVSDDIARCRFSIAMNRKVREEEENEVMFLDIVAWRRLAEVCHEFLTRGKRVAVLGRLRSYEYKDKSDVNRKRFEVVAESVQFLGSPRQENPSCLEERRIFA